MFDFLIWDNQITLDEIFYDMVKEAKNPREPYQEDIIDSLIEDWESHRALFRIYTRMDELKYDKLD